MTTTHAIRFDQHGGPEVLQWREQELPIPARARCGCARKPSG